MWLEEDILGDDHSQCVLPSKQDLKDTLSFSTNFWVIDKQSSVPHSNDYTTQDTI